MLTFYLCDIRWYEKHQNIIIFRKSFLFKELQEGSNAKQNLGEA